MAAKYSETSDTKEDTITSKRSLLMGMAASLMEEVEKKENPESVTYERLWNQLHEVKRKISGLNDDAKPEQNASIREELNSYEKQLAQLESSSSTATKADSEKSCETDKHMSTATLTQMVAMLKEEVEKQGKSRSVKFESAKNDLHEINRKLSAMCRDVPPKTSDKTRNEYERLKRKLDEYRGSMSRAVSTRDRMSECREKIEFIEKRKKEIHRIFQLMTASQAVDLCFLIDCTGSMASYIEEVKQKIQMIVNGSKSAFPHLNLAVSFLGYRDHCDNDDRIVVLPFTESIPQFQTFVGEVKATGGGDAPEDIFGGLEEVIKLDWTKQTRILFHIGDAPCHGTQFHETAIGDDHPGGDPRGLKIEDLLSKIQELKIIYWFAKLNNTTDKMVQEFRNVMGGPEKINQIALTSVEDLVEAVQGSISTSIYLREQNVVDKECDDEIRSESGNHLKSYTLDQREPDWKSIASENVTVLENKFHPDLSSIKTPPKLTRAEHIIKMATNPFAEGELRIAYYGIDNTLIEHTSEIVLKEFKHVGERHNNLAKHKDQLEIQSIAVALAIKFNQIKPEGARDVHFTQVSIGVFSRERKQVYFTLERRIQGRYIKFNNNAGFVNKDAYTATLNAFSHWTYFSTRAYLMVVDLQGVKEENVDHGTKYVLTDPAIHCGHLHRFGNTNFGREGMYRFFRTHYCNSICNALALPRHRFQPEGSKDFGGTTVVAERP